MLNFRPLQQHLQMEYFCRRASSAYDISLIAFYPLYGTNSRFRKQPIWGRRKDIVGMTLELFICIQIVRKACLKPRKPCRGTTMMNQGTHPVGLRLYCLRNCQLLNAVGTEANAKRLREILSSSILWNCGMSVYNYDTWNIQTRDCWALSGNKWKLEQKNISTKTRDRLSICSYWNPPDKKYILWQNPAPPFLSQTIRLHSTRVWLHLFASKNTRSTLAATDKSDSKTALKGIYRICLLLGTSAEKATSTGKKKLKATAKF